MKKFVLVGIGIVIVMVLAIGAINRGVDNTRYGGEALRTQKYDSLEEMNLTVENFPILDGATATQPLRSLIACRAFNLKCFWQENYTREMFVYFNPKDANENKLLEKLLNSKTHEAFVKLIEKKVNLILTATKPSDDELKLAQASKVELEVIPIGWDGFVFLVNKKNPVNNLTTAQLKQIYTKKVESWKVLGGPSWMIKPYVRQKNSGSQELMEKVFMRGESVAEFPEEALYSGMMELIEGIDQHKEAVGYSLYYYKNAMIDRRTDNPEVKIIAVDGVAPNPESIFGKKYPYVFNIYAVIRKDLSPADPAYQIAQWLKSEEGQKVVSEAGYVKMN